MYGIALGKWNTAAGRWFISKRIYLQGYKWTPFIKMKRRKYSDKVTIDVDKFEHLLNCMCNQKYIHEMNQETQKEWQDIIDKSYHEARSLLSPQAIESTE